ncbi:MAG: HlyD family efflux transporter periplasmic adaptor subunit [Candidatus Kapabacteria bacterium]|nr:HlyD family efflux transporter periplasmic adaptor subunit [Ignavibacteriota bacterium]MCW5884544.1 HlyD family efflux transporter periplasmic adaptor subunit [Candidatus Kapabacteria bacterium]
MKRQLIISIVGFLLIIAIGFVSFKAMTSKKGKEPAPLNIEAAKYVKIITAKFDDNQFSLETNGRLNPRNSIEIFSEVQGTMKPETAKFKVGNFFRKGDIIINIEDEESNLQLMAQKSEYLNILAMSMPDIKSDFPDAFNKWSNFIEKIDIYKPLPDLPEYNSSKEKFFLASRRILSQYFTIKNMEVRLNKYQIRAPFDGTVTQSLIETGTLVRPGQKLGEFAGGGSYELEISLNPQDAELINVGNKVKISTETGNINGSIIRKSSSMDPATQTIRYYVQLTGSNLSDGMYLKAEIEGKVIPNSIKIPRKSIINNSYIYTYENGKLGKADIDILALGSEFAYISGIADGTEIISEPLVSPTIGMKIEKVN